MLELYTIAIAARPSASDLQPAKESRSRDGGRSRHAARSLPRSLTPTGTVSNTANASSPEAVGRKAQVAVLKGYLFPQSDLAGTLPFRVTYVHIPSPSFSEFSVSILAVLRCLIRFNKKTLPELRSGRFRQRLFNLCVAALSEPHQSFKVAECQITANPGWGHQLISPGPGTDPALRRSRSLDHKTVIARSKVHVTIAGITGAV